MKKLFYFASIAALAFSSCSKDSTEVTPISPVGETAFIASMDLGSEVTRNHLGSDLKYAWDQGDMVVVNSDNQPAKKLPFITVEGGADAAFTAVEEDLDYLGATGTYYMAYPYSQAIEVVDADPTKPGNGKINGLAVPQEQRYRANSFATMTAPSFIAADAATVSQSNKLKFHAAASYFEFPVKGDGKLKSLTLSITNNGVQNIWGPIDVDVTNTPDAAGNSVYSYEIKNTNNSATQQTDENGSTQQSPYDEVTVDFGNSGLDLNMKEAQKVIFVINSGINIDGATISYNASIEKSSTGADGKVTTTTVEDEGSYTYAKWDKINAGDQIANPYECIEANDYVYGKPVALGIGGDNLINTEDEFIIWAYLNWVQANPEAEAAEGVEIPNEWMKDQKLVGAVIASNLDFEGYLPDPNNPDIYLEGEFRTLAYNALTWYKNNVENFGYGFKTLKDASLEGVSDDITIANAIFSGKVVGSGSIKNLIWDNTTVKATVDGTTDKGDYMFANLYQGGGVKLEGKVTVKGGALAAKGSIAQRAAASVVPALVVDGYPTNAEFVANYLYMDADLDASAFYANNTVAFENVHGSSEAYAGKVLTINDTEDFVDNVINTIPLEGEWFSLMMDGTSYWTGYKGAIRSAANKDDVNGAYFTAEELAFVMGSNGNTVVLNNDIDLRGHRFVATADAEGVVDHRFNWGSILYNAGNNAANNFNGAKTVTDAGVVTESYTISNASILLNKDVNLASTATLLGTRANISNLNVKNVNIAAGVTGYVQTSGLAITGSAKNVAVENIAIAVANGKVSSDVGGVFANASVNSLDGVSAKNVVISYAEGVNTGSAGVVVGMATVDTDAIKTDIKGIVVDGQNSVANTLNQVIGKTRKDINHLVKGTNYSGAYAFGALFVKNVNGIVINKSTSHTHTLVADANCSFGERIAAGVVFPKDFIESTDHKFDKKNVCVGNVDATGKEVVQNHNYMLKSVGLYAGNYEPYSYIGLTSGADVK